MGGQRPVMGRQEEPSLVAASEVCCLEGELSGRGSPEQRVQVTKA